MYDITIHRDINNNIISFPSEQILTVFYAIIKKYNTKTDFERLKISKTELWNMTGLHQSHYSNVKIKELITTLTESNTFKISENTTISGSIFIIEENENNELYIEIPKTYQNYIYNSRDINVISKNKQKVKMNSLELNYYKEEIIKKNKTKENILLLKQADILKIQGKYTKRLYTLLMMRKNKENKNGKLIENYSKFKKTLEIPKSYTQGMIDIRFLHINNKELEKVGITITKINKIKTGKEIKTIEIYFDYEEKISKPKTVKAPKPEYEEKDFITPAQNVKLKAILENPSEKDEADFNNEYEKLSDITKAMAKKEIIRTQWYKKKYFDI